VPCKWNFLFPSVTCVVYSVVAFNVSLTLLCDDAKFKINKINKINTGSCMLRSGSRRVGGRVGAAGTDEQDAR